ncbi:MAG: hypothetical protein JXQ93_08490 [Flavobacteriaceae bacterium]
MKRIGTALFALLPSKLAHLFLKMMGHKISWKSKIGFSFIYTDSIELKDTAKIGHFNFIKVDKISLGENAVIKSLNFFKGPFNIILKEEARIGKQNRFQRATSTVSYGISELIIGKGTGITSRNYLDLMQSIIFGEHSQVAGIGTQFWTHGYIHASKGVERIRIDGQIIIGNNVYIGSRCIFNPGVIVKDAINIGGNSVISKDLNQSGMYVNQPLRYIDTDIHKAREKFLKVDDDLLIEEVYFRTKKNFE